MDSKILNHGVDYTANLLALGRMFDGEVSPRRKDATVFDEVKVKGERAIADGTKSEVMENGIHKIPMVSKPSTNGKESIRLWRMELGRMITCLILWALVTPALILVLVPLLLLLSLWKCGVLLYIKMKHPTSDLVTPSNFMDTGFCVSDLSEVIAYALVGNGIIDLNELREHFSTTFIQNGQDLKYPIFFQTFTTIGGHSYKIRASERFDLNRHFREVELSPGNNSVETEHESYYAVAKDHSQIKGKGFPKWEIVLVHNRTERRSTLIFKISHGLVDGYSVRALLDKLTGQGNLKYRVPETAKHRGILFQIRQFIAIPLQMVEYWKNFKSLHFGVHPFLKDRGIIPKTNLALQSKQYWSKTTLPFDQIKAISKESGCKINPICSSLYISTLRRFLSSRGKWEEGQVGEDVSITYSMPAPSPHPADSGRWCNHHIPAFINLPLREKDSVSQLRIIDDRYKEYDQLDFGWPYFLCQSVLGPVLPQWITSLPIKRMMMHGADHFEIVINPFILSPAGYKILGVGVTGLYFLSSSESTSCARGGIFTALTTPRNQINFSIHGSEDLYQSQGDAEAFTQMFLEEVETLKKEVKEFFQPVDQPARIHEVGKTELNPFPYPKQRANRIIADTPESR